MGSYYDISLVRFSILTDQDVTADTTDGAGAGNPAGSKVMGIFYLYRFALISKTFSFSPQIRSAFWAAAPIGDEVL